MKKGRKPAQSKSEAASKAGPGPGPNIGTITDPVAPFDKWTGTRFRRLAVVLVGIIITQVILYGPSLIGRKILLPLDILAGQNIYLPATATQNITPHNPTLSDLVLLFEPQRRFTVEEFHAGRFPMWAPYQYAGAPAVWPKFSPFLLLGGCTASPVILAWVQLFGALVAGSGAYAFCRKALTVGFWPAAVVAWCYPLTGFFIFWQGYPTCFSAYWLPWLLLAVDKTVRSGGTLAAIGLSLTTCLVLVSGHIDVAGQVLLVSGLYSVWCLIDVHGRCWWQRQSCRAGATLVLGWLLGFLLAAPHLLPLVEYARNSARMARRSAGEEERPPRGLSALPQVVLPDMYGSAQTGSIRYAGGAQTESSAAAYAGLTATLFFAPLAWRSRRHRSSNVFWSLLGFFALGWCLNVPGIVTLLRLPMLNVMSHNRLVFATAFSVLAMAAAGLDALGRENAGRWWFWLPAILLAGVFGWCVYRANFLPDEIAKHLETNIKHGKAVTWIHDLNDVRRAQAWFTQSFVAAAIFSGLGITACLLLWLRPAWRAAAVPVLGVLLVGDLLWFAHNRSAQSDPAFYYPPIPALEQVARATPGRVVGFGCLPAALSAIHGLKDIRGYDGIDPDRMVDLLTSVADPVAPKFSYAIAQWLTPQTVLSAPNFLQLPPAIDMLGVRYVIFRGAMPAGVEPAFQSDDYWVIANTNALPRAFVPAHVEVVADDGARLKKLAAPEFNPRAVAYVESPVNLAGECRGQAVITGEIPTRITIDAVMETPGLVVLADRWDVGWQAYLNGQPVPILRANHAVRGVVAPAGKATIEYRYEPASFTLGLRLAAFAVLILSGLFGAFLWQRRGLTAGHTH